MNDSNQAINNLTYVKEIMQTLSPDLKKELFKHFVSHLSNSATNVNRPKTPETVPESSSTTLKRQLNSPESPKRSKKDYKVSQYI
jgi:hypothetical protein